MNRPTGYLLISVAACGLAAPLRAQDPTVKDRPFRLELSRFYGNGGSHSGNNMGANRTAQLRFGTSAQPFSDGLKRVGFEFEGTRPSQNRTSAGSGVFQTQPTNANIFQNLDARQQQAAVLYHFRKGAKAQPFASVGFAHTKADYSYMCNNCVFDADSGTGNLIRKTSEWGYIGNKIGITFGGGMKFSINRNLVIRSQVQFLNTTDKRGTDLLWIRFQIGLAVHF